ncbi:hypothetical protein CRE_27906 [Caenorhabditis remanei]|uniref:Uncharacterized protein n=1 Tax=Caenorhabditis remanei TaxID=31234 RepID=E3NJ95_CAERE|nr:hypothetical protein CRE_27906 [Caenorhabditis remanei]
MPKRNLRPLYSHDGFTIRTNKVLADGAELVHCTERQTKIGCTASGRRENGVITLVKPHSGHVKDDGIAKPKIAKVDVKDRAASTKLSPRDILHEAKMKHGVGAVVMAGTASSIQRMISRTRDERCVDTDAADAANPKFQGKLTLDDDQEKFLLFDEVVALSGGRNVCFGNKLALEVLEKSKILLTDGTFAVARDPFQQLWSIHAQFGDSSIPVIHVLMSSRSIADYAHALEKIKVLVPNWAPTDYLGDLEIGQAKAVCDAFPGIKKSFCLFHLLQSWYRRLKKLKLDGLTQYGASLYKFWTLLCCLPYGDVTRVEQDFDELICLLPQPPTQEMKEFEEYIRKFYIGPRRSLKFPPLSWNVSDRTLRNLPRTTNAVEAMHRNLERCIRGHRSYVSSNNPLQLKRLFITNKPFERYYQQQSKQEDDDWRDQLRVSTGRENEIHIKSWYENSIKNAHLNIVGDCTESIYFRLEQPDVDQKAPRLLRKQKMKATKSGREGNMKDEEL